jgi:hypothetical protein
MGLMRYILQPQSYPLYKTDNVEVMAKHRRFLDA